MTDADVDAAESAVHEASTRVLRESFTVPAACAEVFVLFTARGERAWAPGWDPQFPSHVTDDSQTGTVFQVVHGGITSTWVVSRSEAPQVIQYARVIPGRNAGLITVTCAGVRSDETRVTVEYHLTALTAEGVHELSRFAAHYPEFIGEWRASVARLFEGRR